MSRGGTEPQVHARVWFQGPPRRPTARRVAARQPRLGSSHKVLSKRRLQAPAPRTHCPKPAQKENPGPRSHLNFAQSPALALTLVTLPICRYFANSQQRENEYTGVFSSF